MSRVSCYTLAHTGPFIIASPKYGKRGGEKRANRAILSRSVRAAAVRADSLTLCLLNGQKREIDESEDDPRGGGEGDPRQGPSGPYARIQVVREKGKHNPSLDSNFFFGAKSTGCNIGSVKSGQILLSHMCHTFGGLSEVTHTLE